MLLAAPRGGASLRGVVMEARPSCMYSDRPLKAQDWTQRTCLGEVLVHSSLCGTGDCVRD